MSTYVVGDIQGCFKPLMQLLKDVNFDPSIDRLWSVGDLINRGPKNLSTLRWFYEHREAVTVVLGNHDLHLLAVVSGARAMGSADNFEDILDAPDRDVLCNWLLHRPLAHHDQGVTMVHAGIPPNWSVEDTLGYAKEVETMLQSPRCIDFFKTMYGNEPYVWREQLRDLTRLRVITNYLTRMRYCTRKGKLDLVSKGATPNPNALAGKKVLPWFSHPNRKTRDDTIIFGHWASLEGVTDNANVIGLDTGCVWGRGMTMYQIETGRRWRTACS